MATNPAPVLETKPALKTTEFWSTMAVHGIMLANLVGVWNFMPNKYAAITMSVVQGLYSISRGQAKQGMPPQ